ncbi:MAG: hypothetical protein AB1578_23755, partial [Thermodesulfobacteriota bacterium]
MRSGLRFPSLCAGALACCLLGLLPGAPRAAGGLTLGFVPDGNTLARSDQEAQALVSHLGRQVGAEVRTASYPDVAALR